MKADVAEQLVNDLKKVHNSIDPKIKDGEVSFNAIEMELTGGQLSKIGEAIGRKKVRFSRSGNKVRFGIG